MYKNTLKNIFVVLHIPGFRFNRCSDSNEVISDTVVKIWAACADALSMQYLW